jgi:hypothetical protein
MTTKLKEDCCEQCIFWDRTMDERINDKTQEIEKVPATSGMGACRVKAPHPYLMTGKNGPIVLAVWPTTPKTGWCGQFERNVGFQPVVSAPAPAVPEPEKSRLIV